ncbi:O-acyltransferase like protein-like [Condylostylus longicornis]|uniref:O-acyltransferase like protein-like n=1 Tax=Condylostylus longicornis TaxID=2530218 RepID=UPI00244E55B4|nr:O-acyltransferase like protein-like [Condylostylus longicornis]
MISKKSTSFYVESPPIYEVENFWECLYGNKLLPSAYCLVFSQIIPKENSSLWKQIQEYSTDFKHNFRHDFLTFGVCVQACKKLLKEKEDENEDEFITSETNIDNLAIKKHLQILNDPDTKFKSYDLTIKKCLNFRFMKKYALELKSITATCTAGSEMVYMRFWDITFILLLLTIIIFIVASSLYDFQLKSKHSCNLNSNLHYKAEIESQSSLRFFLMVSVILSHTLIVMLLVGPSNTQYIEEFHHHFEKNLLLNGTIILQTYFVIGGLLLTLGFNIEINKNKNKNYVKLFLKFILLRYVRLVPIYAFGILFNISFFTKMMHGPFWKYVTQSEKVCCQRYWWANMLFINNYVSLDEQCLPQTWYLAADFQMNMVLLVFLILIEKIPCMKYWILLFWSGLAILLPAITVYLNKFEGVFLIAPESYRYGIWFDEHFKYYFIPTHNNMGGYLVGYILGKVLLKFEETHIQLEKNFKFKLLWYINIPFALFVVFSGLIFYEIDFPKPSIFAAIYAGIIRNLWAVMSGILILGMAYKIGWIIYEICSIPIFRVFGRLSLSCLIFHTHVIRIFCGILHSPPYLSNFIMLIIILGVVCASYVSSFLLTILIEYPIANLVKTLLVKAIKSNI